MGNFINIEHDFVERTLRLIAQYESIKHTYPFEEQLNYTLLLNCMLGIIVMPKERVFSHIPNHRITNELMQEMGLNETVINPQYTHLRSFIRALRNSVSHFSIDIISDDEHNLIDKIVFKRPDQFGGGEVANFTSEELLPFMRYYATWLQHNLNEHE